MNGPVITMPAPESFAPRSRAAIRLCMPSVTFIAGNDNIDADWLATRSPVCPWNRTPASFLHALYNEGDKVIIFDDFRSQGQEVWDASRPALRCKGTKLLRKGKAPWSLVPEQSGRRRSLMSTMTGINPGAATRTSRPGGSCCLRATAPTSPLPSGLRRLFCCRCPSFPSARPEAAWLTLWSRRRRKQRRLGPHQGLPGPGSHDARRRYPFLSAVRLTRLPCCERLGKEDEDGKYQKFADGPHLQRLLYLNPAPDGTPIAQQKAWPQTDPQFKTAQIMNEDDIKKVNECFEERSGVKIPPARRSTRASAQAPQEDVRTAEEWHDVPEHDPPGAEPQGDWPEPEPIRNDLRSVAPLRTEMIPVPLRACILDIAYRMQCPIDFIAAAFVVMASILIGAGCSIKT